MSNERIVRALLLTPMIYYPRSLVACDQGSEFLEQAPLLYRGPSYK